MAKSLSNIIRAGSSATPLPVSFGGTGATTAASSLTALGALPLAGGVMTGAITFAAGQTVANLAAGSAGTIPYQSATGTTAFLAVGTPGQVITSGGAGAPTWSAPSAGGFSQAQVFTSSGAFTVPTSGKFKVTIIGGGGSAATYIGNVNGCSGGGSGGGSVIKWFTGATGGTIATVTIGAGGAAVTSSNTVGNNGGNSTFVLSGFSNLTAGGGGGGLAAYGSAPVAGGTATNGDINVNGGYGTPPVEQQGTANRPTLGGSSLLGIGGANFQANGMSMTGTGYGAGSSGTYYYSAVSGTSGICIVEY